MGNSIEGQENDCQEPSTEYLEKEDKAEAKPKERVDEKEKADEIEPPRVGNFALPTSQQPAGLFAFGGNIIDKDEVQLYFFADEFVGKHRFISDLIPGILFGITDDLSIFFNAPFTPLMKDRDFITLPSLKIYNKDFESSGLEDFFVQLEYEFYSKKTYTYADQATVVANITVPTGSVRKNPPTGYGAPTFFIGATYYHVLVDWFFFTGHGAILPTSNNRTKIGEQFLYQFGLGRNIPSPEGWIYAWMVELDGQYNKKNRIQGIIDPNSGGNLIFVTPSLWVSSKHFLIQFGVSLPINQNLFGRQGKFDYALNLNCAWSFY